jgi:hypothetical protein
VVHKSTGTDTFTMLSSFTGTPLPNNPKRGRTSKKKKKKLHIKLYCAVYIVYRRTMISLRASREPPSCIVIGADRI